MQTLKVLLCLAVTLALVSCQTWVETWSDEFDGNSIDTNKWHFEIGTGDNGWGNNELEYYTDRSDNAFIRDGNLIIRAQKEDYQGAQYTSARMTTQGKFDTVYGKFEARLKLPSGQGIWPAFWLLGSNIGQVGWPACGEIDIMEFVGKDPNNVHSSTHGPGFDTSDPYNNNGGFSDFHTYAANWQPGKIEFYVDNNLFKTVTRDNAGSGSWPFDGNKMFILLNLAVGGKWPGNPDGSTNFPQEFVIDYVRVFELAF